jgi:hypothetical protein
MFSLMKMSSLCVYGRPAAGTIAVAMAIQNSQARFSRETA